MDEVNWVRFAKFGSMEKSVVPRILLRLRSGVQYLEQTGNRLICPGMSNVLSNGNRGARVTEVDPETQDVVFELELEDAIYQRVYRMSLYPENQ